MSAIDIVIIVIITIIMLLILFFSFIYPKFIKKKEGCSSCPINKEKKIKRAFRDYHKKNK